MGAEDRRTVGRYTDEIREWSQHTQSDFNLIEVDGDHWFLNRNRARIISELEDFAARTVPAPADFWEGEAPAEPRRERLGRSLALPVSSKS